MTQVASTGGPERSWRRLDLLVHHPASRWADPDMVKYRFLMVVLLPLSLLVKACRMRAWHITFCAVPASSALKMVFSERSMRARDLLAVRPARRLAPGCSSRFRSPSLHRGSVSPTAATLVWSPLLPHPWLDMEVTRVRRQSNAYSANGTHISASP